MAAELRKKEHIEVCRNYDVNFSTGNGFEKYTLTHNALPEIDIDDIDLSTEFLGKKISYPLYISPITGGANQYAGINRVLARLSDSFNIPMCVGSQRAALENRDLASTFKVQTKAPLYANIGLVQLNYGYGAAELQKAVDMIEADALVLHINPLQEAIQPEGDTDFSGLLKKLAQVTKLLRVPIIAKEVGHGISGMNARKLEEAGVSCIDVAGAGGTSWSAVEGYRARNGLGEAFRDWGIPTAECLVQAREETGLPIISSGGIRTGPDIVKSLCLGAGLCGIAAPLLEPAIESYSSARQCLENLIKEVKIAMFCLGAKQISDLNDGMIQHG